jgi:hypothetical protein
MLLVGVFDVPVAAATGEGVLSKSEIGKNVLVKKTDPIPPPTHEIWEPGQHEALYCANGWRYNLWGQAAYLMCLTGSGKGAAAPGQKEWKPGQNGYILCPNNWQADEGGNVLSLSCPTE